MLASVPQSTKPDLFPEASLYNNLDYGKNRAKIILYVIDPLFHSKTSSLTPSHKGIIHAGEPYNEASLVNEVFPNKQLSTDYS